MADYNKLVEFIKSNSSNVLEYWNEILHFDKILQIENNLDSVLAKSANYRPTVQNELVEMFFELQKIETHLNLSSIILSIQYVGINDFLPLLVKMGTTTNFDEFVKEVKNYELKVLNYEQNHVSANRNLTIAFHKNPLIDDDKSDYFYWYKLFDFYSIDPKMYKNLSNAIFSIGQQLESTKSLIYKQVERCNKLKMKTFIEDDLTNTAKEIYRNWNGIEYGGSDEFVYGKYKGRTLDEILFLDPSYIVWAIENVVGFTVNFSIYHKLLVKKINTPNSDFMFFLKYFADDRLAEIQYNEELEDARMANFMSYAKEENKNFSSDFEGFFHEDML